jgi:hypothetical protein
LAGSSATFAQNAVGAVPQVVRLAPQLAPHTPPEHTWPAAHLVAQSPQWALSVWRWTHAPPHTESPALHEGAHAPAAHALPGGHAVAQSPQCELSSIRSAHTPPQAR